MKKNCISIIYTTILFLVVFTKPVFSQSFEGKIAYSIQYIIHNKKIKVDCLNKSLGDNELITIKEDKCKAELKLGNELLGVVIFKAKDSTRFQYSANDNYCLKTILNKDSAEKIIRKDTLVHIGKYLCEVFQSKKGFSQITWYVLKGSTDYSGLVWFPAITPFKSPLIRLVVDNIDYSFIEDLKSISKSSVNESEFSSGNRRLITSSNMVINEVISSDDRNKLQRNIGRKAGYPLFMQLQNIEGKVFLDFILNANGKISDVRVTTSYFRDSKKIEKIKNCKRIERIRSKIEKKLIAVFNDCTQVTPFNPPVSKDGKVSILVRIPIIYGYYYSDRSDNSMDDDDNYEMFEDFYEREML